MVAIRPVGAVLDTAALASGEAPAYGHQLCRYLKTLFWLTAPVVWLSVVLLPARSQRWTVMRIGTRLLFRLAGVRLQVDGLERLSPNCATVIVANHASYLDSVVRVAALPVEMEHKFLPRLFLRRIGVCFIDRFDWRQGATDARGMVDE